MRRSPVPSSHSVDAWLFVLADDADAWKKAHDESRFRPVRVPHDWSVEHDFDPSCSSGTGYLPGGVGWYRSHVSLAAIGHRRGQQVRLVFHGVYKNADVWVNGYHLGGRPSGHAEFSFDLTEVVSYAPDDDLVISVRVDRREIADSRWYNGAGITRGVELQLHDEVAVEPHSAQCTTLQADRTRATVELALTVANHDERARRVEVVHALSTLDGAEVHRSSQVVEVEAGGLHPVTTTIELDAPRLWSDDDPQLYRWTTWLVTEGHTPSAEAALEEFVGLRTFAFDPDTGFSVNGEPRVLKGVCLHEDAGPLGTAVPPVVWVRRLLALKEVGCNAVRMAHNSHAPELYRLCDLLGFYVIDEAFDEWENPKNKWWQGHNVYPPKHEGYATHFPQWGEQDLADLVRAHRIHPSIIAWSIGNEIDYPNDPYASPLFEQMTGNNDANKPSAERVYDPSRPDVRRLTTLARRLAAVVRRHDTSRPVTLAVAFPELSSQTGLLEPLDLVGYNYKEHLYADDHRRFPDKPLVGSETSHTWAAWRHVVEAPYVAGQFLWTGIDYLGETPGWPSHGSGAGLLTTAGFPKERFQLRRSWWSDQPVVRLAVRPWQPTDPSQDRYRPFTRNWLSDGGRQEVACFSNVGAVAVSCGEQEVELTFDEERGHWRGVVEACGAPIVARATADGNDVHDELHPRGGAVQLAARVWQLPAAVAGPLSLLLGEDDVHQVECVLLDANGRRSFADAEVDVAVEGGELLGVDNGDLSDTTPYRSTRRRTHEGRLLVHLRGGDGATVVLRADGLAPVRLEVGGAAVDVGVARV